MKASYHIDVADKITHPAIYDIYLPSTYERYIQGGQNTQFLIGKIALFTKIKYPLT